MNQETGLDLLLNYSPFSERIHQVVLACLLKDVVVTRALGLAGTPLATKIETHGGLFDITVLMENDARIHVELKLDAVLGPSQLERQRDKIEAVQDQMLYILLGGSQFLISGDQLRASWAGATTTTIHFGDDGRTIPGLSKPQFSSVPNVLQLADLATALGKATPGIGTPAVRELAQAYLRCLESIQRSFDDWRITPMSHWRASQWNSFYQYVHVALLPAGTLVNHYGQPTLSWGYRELPGLRLAVDDFLEYGVYLVADKELSINVGAKFDHDDASHSRGVRADFGRLLRKAAATKGLELSFSRRKIGQSMKVAWLRVADLCTDGDGILQWSKVVGLLHQIEDVLETAVNSLYQQENMPRPKPWHA